jgi:hypothetical protein
MIDSLVSTGFLPEPKKAVIVTGDFKTRDATIGVIGVSDQPTVTLEVG